LITLVSIKTSLELFFKKSYQVRIKLIFLFHVFFKSKITTVN